MSCIHPQNTEDAMVSDAAIIIGSTKKNLSEYFILVDQRLGSVGLPHNCFNKCYHRHGCTFALRVITEVSVRSL